MHLRMIAAIAVLVVGWSADATAADCPAAPADLQQLQTTIAAGRFVSYQPTSLRVIGGQLTEASAESILADLQVLRPYFDGLVTYGARNGAERIPDAAATLGFRSVIVGVWNPNDPIEVANAIAAWERNPNLVGGVSLGNEIILSKRGSWATLQRALTEVRARAPRLALTVTEPFAQFLDDPEARTIFPQMDFMLANVHPSFEPWFKDAPPFNWADFVVRVADRLATEAFCGPLLIKETGVPTGPAALGYTEEKQRAFYRELESQMKPSRTRAFSYFAAFDAPWLVDAPSPFPGTHPEEAFWGLFTEGRAPKAVIKELRPLADAAR
jgi:exo-beta-1,3-glucanase (GH17 family)